MHVEYKMIFKGKVDNTIIHHFISYQERFYYIDATELQYKLQD